jgi:hypothetical protein
MGLECCPHLNEDGHGDIGGQRGEVGAVSNKDYHSARSAGGIGLALSSSDDRTGCGFRKNLIGLLLPIAEKTWHAAKELVLGRISGLVH